MEKPLPFSWGPVESQDYQEYAPREAALKEPVTPHDAPLSQRRRKPVAEDISRMIALQAIAIEKQRALSELLGENVSREMIRTPTSRNWEGYEYAVGLMPPEKQEAVRVIQENFWIQDDGNKTQSPEYLQQNETELEAYTRVGIVRDEALKAILTPEEFELYQRNSTPAGTELLRRTIGMEPSEEEVLAMYRVTVDYWKKTGAVHNVWRAIRVPREQIAQADQKLAEDLLAALGPERFVDYQMATSEVVCLRQACVT